MADVLPDLALRPGRVEDAAALRALGEAVVPATYGPLDAAYAAMMLEERPALLRYARKLTNEASAAEDLVQDALLRAWAARTRFQPGTNFRAWLFRIARNAFLSGLRRTRRHVGWNPEAHDRLMISAPMQDDAVYQADFEKALQLLPVEQAEAFLSVTRDDTPYAVAAERLGIERGTLSSRVARARSTLRMRCLDDDLAESGGDTAFAPGERPVAPRRDRYAQWKASGCRMIG